MTDISGTGTLNFRGAELAVTVRLWNEHLSIESLEVAEGAIINLANGVEAAAPNLVAVKDAEGKISVFSAPLIEG